ncbi:MAG: hypothetical protein LKG40_05085 [Lachnospiraceae bacterium]|jgi:hypothetical protein|nr:hypothetical protein [Lachnospiraceae bacterium]
MPKISVGPLLCGSFTLWALHSLVPSLCGFLQFANSSRRGRLAEAKCLPSNEETHGNDGTMGEISAIG